jgi:ABC-2 type transport system ATP-binding protein
VTAAIRAIGLTKQYAGKRALDSVDLDVDEGSVFGFLGPNGAGKTTMLRLLTGLSRPSAGSVEIFGRPVTTRGTSARAELGFLPDVPAFYEWMTAPEFLTFAGGLFGLAGKPLRDRSEMLLDLAGLTGVTTRIGGYSRGMKQRLGVAQALINAPRLLLLDEPTSALDPIGRKDVLDMIHSLRGRTTVFFSTHILGDVERVCDTVAILDHGRIAARAPIDELKRRYGTQRVVVEVTEGADALASTISKAGWATSVSRGSQGELAVTVKDVDAARREIPALVARQGVGLIRMEAGELGLEEVFVELVGGGAGGETA